MDQPEISVILLCYGLNEQITKTVSEVHQVLKDSSLEYEIVLVANYRETPDRSSAIANEISKSDPRVKAVSIKKAGMYGWDVKQGVAASSGKYIVYCDGDGQFPFVDILRVYEKMRSDGSDFGTTYRTRRDDPPWRTMISYVFNILFRILFPGANVIDVNAKPKALTRDLFNSLNPVSNDWFIDAEIIIGIRRKNLSVTQVPTVFNKLEGRKSLIKPSSILEFLRNMLRYWAHEITRHNKV